MWRLRRYAQEIAGLQVYSRMVYAHFCFALKERHPLVLLLDEQLRAGVGGTGNAFNFKIPAAQQDLKYLFTRQWREIA